MNSKPVVALEEVASDLIQAIAHYSTWRADVKDLVSHHALGNTTTSWEITSAA